MSIRERMKQGLLYRDNGEGLEEERARCKEMLFDYNQTRPSETEKRLNLLQEILGSLGESGWIEPPLRMAYGSRTHIGKNFYANFNLVVVDDGEVHIGDNVQIGPNVTISPTGHPVDPELRRGGTQFSLPIMIGDDVWIGANVVILPGISIGKNSVIGAGSVVTRDIPENVIAVGNPCRVLREINARDKLYYHKDKMVDDYPF